MASEPAAQKISVVINTYNAERDLPRCLAALKGFDEILVCDMESTDSTVAIAQEAGCRVVTFPRGEHRICEVARDFAIHSAANDWVLVVDADEIVIPELRNYLYDRIASADCPAGLCLPRKNHVYGVFLPFSYPDYQLRFLRKSLTVWPPEVHSRPQVSGEVQNVPKARTELALLHMPHFTEAEQIGKLNTYSDNEARTRSKGKRASIGKLLFSPFFRFFRFYVLKGGFRLGRLGFILACNDAIYKFLILAKLYEAERLEDGKK